MACRGHVRCTVRDLGPAIFLHQARAHWVPPVGVAWARIALGTAVLLPVAWRRGSLVGLGSAQARHSGVRVRRAHHSILLISLGEQWVSSSLAGILIATVPLIVLIAVARCSASMSPWRRGACRVSSWARRRRDLARSRRGPGCRSGGPVERRGDRDGRLRCRLTDRPATPVKDVDELGAVAASLASCDRSLTASGRIYWCPSADACAAGVDYIACWELGVICTALALSLYFWLIARNRRSAGRRHHVHEPGGGGASGCHGVARVLRAGLPSGTRVDSRGLVAGDSERRQPRDRPLE